MVQAPCPWRTIGRYGGSCCRGRSASPFPSRKRFRVPMKIRVRADLVYRFDPPTDAIYKIQVAHWPGQTVLEESLTTTPAIDFIEDQDEEFGARTLRAHLSGEVALT